MAINNQSCGDNEMPKSSEPQQHSESFNSHSFLQNKTLANSRRFLRNGAERISNSFRNLRTTMENFSQRIFWRRHRLADSSCQSPATPQNIKEVLGRSPAKLYSPFGIETPHHLENGMTPYMPDTPNELCDEKKTNAWRLLPKKRPRALFR